jgi:DNA-binding response OmpR family regulator
MQELIIRVKALLNRAIIDKTVQTTFNIGNYTFDSVSQTLAWENEIEELSHLENEILKRLSMNINRVVDIRSLLLDLWNDDSPYNLNSLHGYMHKLRKLLQKDETVKIINERSIGYKLVSGKK